MVSTWLSFVIIEVSKDKKHSYQDNLLIICKAIELVNLQSNPEDRRDSTR